jgi:hypothetical protein
MLGLLVSERENDVIHELDDLATGGRSFFASAPVGAGGWTVVVAVAESTVTGPIWRSTAETAGVAVVGIALISMVIFFPTRRLSERITLAASAAQKVAAGDLTGAPIRSELPNEAGDLLRALDSMNADLNSLVGQVRAASMDLSSTSTELATTSHLQAEVVASFGASMMDDKGNVTIRGNAKLRTAVEYMVKLSRFLPNDVWAWDDASNNRALISGRSALIFNPPSAWAVAKRDNPQVSENCWTVPLPAGPEGRFTPYLPYFWGIWSFSRNKTAAKGLLEFLSERSSAEKQTTTSNGYDIPPFLSMSDFAIWENEGPPKGTVFNYPQKAHHNARTSVAFAPAPAEFAVQAYTNGLNTKMIARIAQGGETIDQALAWAERELNVIRRG